LLARPERHGRRPSLADCRTRSTRWTSEASRRLVMETVDYLGRQLASLPPTPAPSKARRYMQAVYGRRANEAISVLRERVTDAPNDVQARSELGRMLLVSGDRAGSIKEYDALVARSDLPERTRSTALYNLACAHALEGHKDAALGRLEDAAAAGFTNANEISADPDLESLRQEPRYRALIERLGGASAGDARR